MKKLIVIGVVAVLAGASGFFVPRLFLSGGAEKQEKSDEHGDHEQDAEHGEDAGGAAEATYVEFGSVVVNLNEERLSRYIRVSIKLMVDKGQSESVSKDLEKRNAILKNWLISYLADKTLEEVKGTAGYNRARREIRDQFNQLLFSDGVERIQEVLFDEFTVQ